MSAKYTPGPWEIEDGYAIVHQMSDGTELIGTVSDPSPEFSKDANARLIAHAPALVECLRELVSSFVVPDDAKGDDCRAIINARALLAEIEGKS